MAKKLKFYTVWKGIKTGVFDNWLECKKNIDGFEGAQYKSFETKIAAERALTQSYFAHINKSQTVAKIGRSPKPIINAIVVDAAWNTKTGDMEYQGIEYPSMRPIFHQGPFADGTNNIGEYLAVVHALALLHKNNSNLPIFSDSKTAISWVNRKKANTKLVRNPSNAILFDMLERADKWLNEHRFANKILKWETEDWGENPADFGRK